MKNKSDMPTHVIEDWERAIERFQKSADPIIKRNQEKIRVFCLRLFEPRSREKCFLHPHDK